MDRDNPNRDESPIMGDSNEASYGETKSSPERATHFRESYFIEEDEEEAPEQSFSRREVAPEGKGLQEEEPILSTPSTRESIGVERSSSERKSPQPQKRHNPNPHPHPNRRKNLRKAP